MLVCNVITHSRSVRSIYKVCPFVVCVWDTIRGSTSSPTMYVSIIKRWMLRWVITVITNLITSYAARLIARRRSTVVQPTDGGKKSSSSNNNHLVWSVLEGNRLVLHRRDSSSNKNEYAIFQLADRDLFHGINYVPFDCNSAGKMKSHYGYWRICVRLVF